MVKKRKKTVNKKLKKTSRKALKPIKIGANRKDFEVFAKGVERLEELKVELNSLDTSKYPAEVAAIRSKLKNVSYIPEIEQEMKALKSKIGGKFKGPQTPNSSAKINKKIKELEKKVNKRRPVRKSKEVSKIPKIEAQVSYLKGILKKQKEEEDRKEELLRHIDPSVNLLVNTKLDMSLNEIKAELSKKLKEKQTAIKEQLQQDLENRKKNFELQYKNLQNKFEDRYEKNVQQHL